MAAILNPFFSEHYDRGVTCIAMDARFLIVGQQDGNVSVHYIDNGIRTFWAKVSKKEDAITAVSCEENDDIWNEIFYVADAANNIFVLNKEQMS